MATTISSGLDGLNNVNLDKLTTLIKKIIADLEKAKKDGEDADKKKKADEEAKKKKEEDCPCAGATFRPFWEDVTRKHIKPVLDDIARRNR